MKQSGQVGKMETTLGGNIGNPTHALATVMEKIQNHLNHRTGDPDEDLSVDEMSGVSQSIPPQAESSGEIVESTVLSGSSYSSMIYENEL